MTKLELRQTIGRRIRAVRVDKNITQTKLAEKVGLTGVSHLSKIELGQKQPNLYLLYKIEKVLGPIWVGMRV